MGIKLKGSLGSSTSAETNISHDTWKSSWNVDSPQCLYSAEWLQTLSSTHSSRLTKLDKWKGINGWSLDLVFSVGSLSANKCLINGPVAYLRILQFLNMSDSTGKYFSFWLLPQGSRGLNVFAVELGVVAASDEQSWEKSSFLSSYQPRWSVSGLRPRTGDWQAFSCLLATPWEHFCWWALSSASSRVTDRTRKPPDLWVIAEVEKPQMPHPSTGELGSSSEVRSWRYRILKVSECWDALAKEVVGPLLSDREHGRV